MNSTYLLGLPYVQPTPSGILLLRHGLPARCTLKVYRFGDLLWSGPISLRSDVDQPSHFRLVFPERPAKLTFMIFVEADFGPRVSHVAFPINCVFPTIKVGTKYHLWSQDIFRSNGWRDIIVQLVKAIASQQVVLKRKLQTHLPKNLGG